MIDGNWNVKISGQAKHAKKNLSRDAIESFALLLKELIFIGPYRVNWPNYTKMKGSSEDYHCHLKKGKPTYVACWTILDKKQKIMEVYYAGTHENAPY